MFIAQCAAVVWWYVTFTNMKYGAFKTIFIRRSLVYYSSAAIRSFGLMPEIKTMPFRKTENMCCVVFVPFLFSPHKFLWIMICCAENICICCVAICDRNGRRRYFFLAISITHLLDENCFYLFINPSPVRWTLVIRVLSVRGIHWNRLRFFSPHTLPAHAFPHWCGLVWLWVVFVCIFNNLCVDASIGQHLIGDRAKPK